MPCKDLPGGSHFRVAEEKILPPLQDIICYAAFDRKEGEQLPDGSPIAVLLNDYGETVVLQVPSFYNADC